LSKAQSNGKFHERNNASAEHVGASLQQRAATSGPWQPLGFFSKKLEPAQTRYSAFDCELWACFSGIRHFRHAVGQEIHPLH
jgi:hypothetical protein